MAGPSLQNLSSYQPSRQTFSDATGIANSFNAGLGDANVNPIADVAQGIDKGISLGTKANAFLESISPRAEEERRNNLEISRAQASISQQQAEQAQTQMQKDALTKENDLLTAKNKSDYDALNSKTQIKQAILANKAADALNQVNDPASFLGVVNDPQYATLRTFDPYKTVIAGQAQAMLSQTTDPVQQVKLLQIMESSKPGSTKEQIQFLPQETQKLLTSPKDLAESEKAQADALKAKAEAGKINSEVAAAGQIDTSAPYDPTQAALEQAGIPTKTSPGAAPAPGAPGTSNVGAPNMPAAGTPGGTVTPNSQGTNQQAAPVPGSQGTALPIPQTGTPLTPAQEATFNLTKQQAATADEKRATVDKILASPGTPGEKKRDALLRENIRQFPNMEASARVKYVDDQAKLTDLNEKQADELGKFRESVNNLDVSQMRMQAAFKTIDDFITNHGDANLGPTEKVDRASILARAAVIGSDKEQKDLIAAWDELDAQGLRNALVDLSTMKLGQTAIMMNTDTEREAQQKIYTGSNITYERNKQAFDILRAKSDQAKGILSIIDGSQILGRSYNDAVRVADRWRSANNPLEVGNVNGVPEVQLKKPGTTIGASEYLYNTLNLDKYVQRAPDGRVIPSQPADPHALATDVGGKLESGTKIPVPKASDISSRMNEASDALILRTISQESNFKPDAVSEVGAKGLMQLMDGTGEKLWKDHGFKGDYDPFDAEKNIVMGTAYLNQQLKDFNGDTRLALAAYNAGPGRVHEVIDAYNTAEEKLGRTDYNAVQHYLPKQTKDYVKKIMGDGEDLQKEKGSLTPIEYRGAFQQLPTQKAQAYAQSNLSPEGLSAMKSTNDIKTVSDTKGTILEDITGALLAANPFAATEAKAETPAPEEIGSNDSRTRVLNKDGTTTFEGMTDPGNIPNLFNRPQIKNPSGDVSTTKSMSFQGVDGKEVLIPTIINGKQLTDEEAKSHYRITGEHLGKFDSPEAADAYAVALSDAQGKAIDQSTAQPKEAAKKPKDESGLDLPDSLQAIALGAARGLLFGGDDEVFALARMAIHHETWDQATANTRKIRDALQEAHPNLYALGNVAGGLLSPVPGALFKGAASVLRAGKAVQSGNAIAQATKVAEAAKAANSGGIVSTLAKSAATGAGIGGMTGFFEGEAGANGEELSNRLSRGLQGALFGGVTGAVLGPLVYKMAKGTGNFTPEERSILKNMMGLGDKELQQHIDELAASGNPAGSVLAKLGINKIKSYIDLIARNPNSSADVINMAEENLGGQAGRVAGLVGKSKDSAQAAADLSKVVEKKVKDFYKERVIIGDKYYTPAEEAAAQNSIQSKSKFAKLRFAQPAQHESVMYGPGNTATTTASRHDQMVDAALSKKQIEGAESSRVSDSTQASSASGRRQKTIPESAGIGGPSQIDKAPVETPYNVYGVPESKVQRFRDKAIIPSADRPAFVSDEVAKAVEDPHVADAVLRAKRIVDKGDLLEANDFAVLQQADSMLGYESTLGGTEGFLAKQAHEKLHSAMAEENKLYGVATEKYKEASDSLSARYSKGIQKLEKYSAPDGSIDVTKIHDDLMSLGASEIKSIMGELNPQEQEAVRESARSFIVDKLKDRGARATGDETQKFPSFTKNMGDEKIKAIFGDKQGSAIIDGLHEEAQISAVANKIIKSVPAAEKGFEKQAQRYEDLSKADQAKFGAAIGMMGIWGVNRYTSSIAGIAAIKALNSFVRSAKYSKSSELAQGIADKLYLDPKAGLEFLEKVSNHVKTELPQYYPTWQKAVATAAQMIVSGGNEGEPQTTARDNKRRTEITIHYDPKVNAPQ